MQRYLKKILMPGEHVLFTARLHRTIYSGGIIMLVLGALIGSLGDRMAYGLLSPQIADMVVLPVKIVALFIVGMGALELFFTFLRQISTEIVVTNYRVIAKEGFGGAHIYQTMINKITSVNIEQTMKGRLLDFGAVTILASGGDIPPVLAVADPYRLHAAIMNEVQRVSRLKITAPQDERVLGHEKTRLLQ